MKSSSAFWWLHSRLWKGFGFISKPFSGAQPSSGVKGHEAGGNVLAGDVSAIWTCVADCFSDPPESLHIHPWSPAPFGQPKRHPCLCPSHRHPHWMQAEGCWGANPILFLSLGAPHSLKHRRVPVCRLCSLPAPTLSAHPMLPHAQPLACSSLPRGQEQFQTNPDSYNGAVRENYAWSQDYSDLEIKVPVPKHIVKGKQVKQH